MFSINYRVNGEITSDNTLLIEADQTIKAPTKDALELAETRGLDLVEMSKQPDGTSVCKIMDYGKFMFETQKKQKATKSNKVELKEIRMGNHIAQADLEIKAKSIDRILSEGDKVKVSIVFKGREARSVNSGAVRMETIKTLLHSKFLVDKNVYVEGNRSVMILSPSAPKLHK